VIELVSGPARVLWDLENGGRLASLQVHGLELLVTEADNPIDWGCYPMAPFAGRLRDGQLHHKGTHQLPLNLGDHAIHGTVFDRPWVSRGDGWALCTLGERWPWPGVVRQHLRLTDDGLLLQLVLESATPFPATLGWHPWFRRQLDRGEPVVLSFGAESMYRRDAAGLPDGTLVPPPPGPWDDCFFAPGQVPALRWPKALELRLASDLDHWVIFSERDHALCVEPQSGPPDGPNLVPHLVTPQHPLTATLALLWTLL